MVYTPSPSLLNNIVCWLKITSMLDTSMCSTHTILSFVMNLSWKEEDLFICCWFIREWGVLSLSFLLVFEFIIVKKNWTLDTCIVIWNIFYLPKTECHVMNDVAYCYRHHRLYIVNWLTFSYRKFFTKHFCFVQNDFLVWFFTHSKIFHHL